MKKALAGSKCAALAMKQINPDVVAVYPITPQTEIAEHFAEYVADGDVDTELIRVESEHSAMSACVGASAAGARVMTASASVGLALMGEVLGVASGLRLPIVMNIANRALSAPINIHCDHSDTMMMRDTGWVQLYCENNQEVYDYNFIAMKLAEKALIPVMVCQDGFITSHCVEGIDVLDDKKIRVFVGSYKPEVSLSDLKKPKTFGALCLTDYFFEVKWQEAQALNEVKKIYLEVCNEFEKITGRKYDAVEKYKLNDAEAAIVIMASSSGAAKDVVDKMRKEGKKVGLLRIIMFRPFNYELVSKALKDIKRIVVFDRSESFGANAPLFSEIKNSVECEIKSCVYGLGGRDLFEREIEDVLNKLLLGKLKNKEYVGCRI